MRRVLFIGIGGFVGSVARYALGGAAQAAFRDAAFPFGTAVVNISGCLVIGVLSYLAEARGAFTDATRALVFTGLLGGYTTFSTFGNETVSLARSGETALAAGNVLAQVGLGLAAVWLGRALAFTVWR